jgi:hypothetical protein
MRTLTRSILVAVLFASTMLFASAQSSTKQGTATITGRVYSGDKPVVNVAVIVYPVERAMERSAVARATTDAEGRYRLANVPAGQFSVYFIAPTMVGISDTMYGEQGMTVTIADGETVEKLDFSLVRGGVITGRITNADGDPIIGEQIHLNLVDKSQRRRGVPSMNYFMYETDDRGVYRLYGIAPGKYTVSIGEAKEEGSIRFGFGGRGYYTRTFYPSVTDESKATALEVTQGSEASNVDITVGRKSKSYAASGRVVDDNGQPVPNLRVGAGGLVRDNQMGGLGSGALSDAQGQFRLDGLLPGRYAAFIWNDGTSNGYTDPIKFEIVDGDVSGIELKLRRGSSISGVVVIEGTSDRSVLATLSQLSLFAFGQSSAERLAAPSFNSAKVSSDGSFRISGLEPGKAQIALSGFPPPKGFTLSRIERDGVPQKEIEVPAGAQLTGFRVVIQYGSGRVRGLVKMEGGAISEGMRIMARIRPVSGEADNMNRPSMVDSRGRFLIEGIVPGEYEVSVEAIVMEGRPRRIPSVRQRVTVANGVESEVNLTLDLSVKQPEGSNNE